MKKKLAIAALVASFAVPAALWASEGAPKFPILHKGNWIEVSCNAGQGHLQHADWIEYFSILISGWFNCR